MVPFLAANCVVCHNAERLAGNVNLAPFQSAVSLRDDRDTWEVILFMLESGAMPPDELPEASIPPGGIPNPAAAQRARAAALIRAEMDRLDGPVEAQAGKITIRRLNRAEYNNTVRDLLGVQAWPADEFPQDDSIAGFDNIGDALSMSPLLLEKYMQAAEAVARAAVYGPKRLEPTLARLEQLERNHPDTREVPAEYDVTGLNLDRSLHHIHRFPVDGEYLFRVVSRGFRPLGSNPLELGLWLDGQLVAELRVDPEEDGPSLLGGRQDLFGKPQDFRMHVTAGDHWVAASVLRMYEGLPPGYGGPNPAPPAAPETQPEERPADEAPADEAPAEEAPLGVGVDDIAVEAAAQDDPANAPVDTAIDAAAQEAVPADPNAQVEPAAASDPAAQAAQAEPGREGARRGEPGRGREGRRGRGGRGRGRGRGRRMAPIDTQIGIDYVDVIGPFEQAAGPSAASLQKVFVCGHAPGEHDESCTRLIIEHVARRAFRRPATEEEIQPYLDVAKLVREAGDSFEESLVFALQGILVSPDFLFRIERPAPAVADADQPADVPISQHELATRLSYFLWSSMPDDELLRLADEGTLRDPDVLATQVRRMIADPRSDALIENFGGQWLEIRKLESVTPDFEAFGAFDEYLRLCMRRETELFLAAILREDRSILEIIDADYTFLNERLAEYYGIEGVAGTEFRRWDLPADSPRGGVLAHASVLTVTSYATRTSPVLRGKWILENILNDPPPPPPDNVPGLEETTKNNPSLSMREQLAIHRGRPACAGCHARMDPLGLGLENFDAIGLWRDVDGEHAVDSSGELPDGRSFSGPLELKQVVLADRDAFTECLTEKLLTYALGRALQPYDRPAVAEIAARVAEDDYRFSRLILEIARSLPFQYQRGG